MKRSDNRSRRIQGAKPRQLMQLIAAYRASSSRLEDLFWESRLLEAIRRQLISGDDEAIESVIDALQSDSSRMLDAFFDLVEYGAEALAPPLDDRQCLLVVLPVLASSRFHIPAGALPDAVLERFSGSVRELIAAPGTTLALANYLFSPDQLPRGYAETFRLLKRFGDAMSAGKHLAIAEHTLPETTRFLSDARYILAAIEAPAGSALFRWQDEPNARESLDKAWHEASTPIFRQLLPACAVESASPAAYHAAIRNVDRLSRPFSVKAAIAFVATSLEVPPSELFAVVGTCYDQQPEELRIALCRKGSPDVLHGVVWPLLDADETPDDSLTQVESALTGEGLTLIRRIDDRLPLEYCDDCGAPLFPNQDGEFEHAELGHEHGGDPVMHLH